jgi:hypothetical protein
MIYNELDVVIIGRESGLWTVEYRLPDGEQTSFVLHNALMNEGTQQYLEIFYRNNSGLTSPFYLGLGNNGGTPGVPAATATLATITEVSGSGYARIALVRGTTDWNATVFAGGQWSVTSATKTFTASGTWTAADYLFLTDVSSGTTGKLIATAALSASRVLQNGDQLNASLKIIQV